MGIFFRYSLGQVTINQKLVQLVESFFFYNSENLKNILHA